jgi:hypothetical protein
VSSGFSIRWSKRLSPNSCPAVAESLLPGSAYGPEFLFKIGDYRRHKVTPSKETVCGLAPPLSLIVTAPLPGERDHVTFMLQEWFAVTLAPQVLV